MINDANGWRPMLHPSEFRGWGWICRHKHFALPCELHHFALLPEPVAPCEGWVTRSDQVVSRDASNAHPNTVSRVQHFIGRCATTILSLFQLCSGNSPIFFKFFFHFLGCYWVIWGMEQFSVHTAALWLPWRPTWSNAIAMTQPLL